MSSVNVFIEKIMLISSFEEDSGDFVIKVNEMLHDGWNVCGGVVKWLRSIEWSGSWESIALILARLLLGENGSASDFTCCAN